MIFFLSKWNQYSKVASMFTTTSEICCGPDELRTSEHVGPLQIFTEILEIRGISTYVQSGGCDSPIT